MEFLKEDNASETIQESPETHISSHLDEVVAAVSITSRKKAHNKLPQTALFQPPREKLHLCEERVKSYSSNHQYKQAIQELVRCLALTRICYGDSHWKLADAHVNLAEGYLQLKGFSLQAKQHAEKAKEILVSAIVSPYNDNSDVFKCSVELFCTLGKALLSLQKFKEASENLTKADKLSKELLQCGRIIKEEWTEIQARIKFSFAQVYQCQKKLKEALPHYKEALEYTVNSKGDKSIECVPILRELAGTEQALGFHNEAISRLLQAHLIVQSKKPSQDQASDSAHFVARAAVASGKPEYHEVAEKFFQESMGHLKDCEGKGRAKFLSIQDEFCHFLQSIGQEERATLVQKESLEAKVGAFGDFSPKVAETYRLLGKADLAQGNHSGAHKKLKKLERPQGKIARPGWNTVPTPGPVSEATRVLPWRTMVVANSNTLAKGWSKVTGESRDTDEDLEAPAFANPECLQIQSLLYGPQDKRTLATQQTVDILSKTPEVAMKPRQSLKNKLDLCIGLPQNPSLGKARPHVVD